MGHENSVTNDNSALRIMMRLWWICRSFVAVIMSMGLVSVTGLVLWGLVLFDGGGSTLVYFDLCIVFKLNAYI